MIIAVTSISCSGYSPAIIHNKTLYLGLFHLEQQIHDPNMKYSSLKGGGLAIGLFHLGMGYFNNKQMTLTPGGSFHAKTPIAEVYVGQKAIENIDAVLNDINKKGNNNGKTY